MSGSQTNQGRTKRMQATARMAIYRVSNVLRSPETFAQWTGPQALM
jgi:hypothetical protein